jgi:hypothetical protein
MKVRMLLDYNAAMKHLLGFMEDFINRHGLWGEVRCRCGLAPICQGLGAAFSGLVEQMDFAAVTQHSRPLSFGCGGGWRGSAFES